tara:strand:- start:164 stop:355 length:192 start_codon:yes stop_codon:yes gene_type:complete
MELLAYTLAFFGFFVLIKGIKPTMEWINNIIDKNLGKGVALIAILLAVCFYILTAVSYLISFR